MIYQAKLSKLPFQILAPLLAVLLAFVITFSYMAWIISNRFSALQEELSISTTATRSLLEIARLRGDAKGSLLLYRNTRDPKYLAELNETETERSTAVDRLEQEVRPIENNYVLFESFFSGALEVQDLKDRILDSIAQHDDKRTAKLFDTYEILYDISGARLTDLYATTRRHVTGAEKEMRSLIQQLPIVLLGMVALGILGSWAMTRFYRQRVLRPLSNLHNGFRDVASGLLGRQLTVLPAPIEIKDMTYDFNTMTLQLEKTTRELNRARNEAMRAANVKSEFLANMSHEIRTPLNVIVGIADLMHERPADAEAQKEIDVLKKSSGMLLGIVNDILDYSRLESGEVKLSRENYEIREAMETVTSMVEPIAKAKGLQLGLSVSSEVPKLIIGDSQLFRQALLNLVNNAIKFTSVGSVKIHAKALFGDSAPILVLTVIDTGIGVAPEKLSTLFTRFTQADTSITRTHGGTGLGLAIVKQIATLFKGEVEANSTPGVGSTFILRMPIEPATSAESQNLTYSAPDLKKFKGFSRTPSILLIDDSVDNRFLIKSYLKNTGAKITEGSNGREAIEAFGRGKFDIILMDIQMPVMDGHQAAREIRQIEQEKQLSHTPIVALTAFALKEEVERSLASGCDRHMAKPIRKTELLDTIELYLGVSQLAGAKLAADSPILNLE
jgi:signal transduction histidine kinase/ActR/RegA family two-component response regulator